MTRRRRRAVIAGGAAILAAVVLLPGFRAEDGIDTAPDARTIEVTAHNGWWEVRYLADSPHRMVITANEVHLPVGERVRFRLESQETIRNFRIRNLSSRVAIPADGEATLTVEPRQTGVYRGGCTRFCSPRHARMQLLVVVRDAPGFEEWLDSQRQPAPPPRDAMAQRGYEVFVGGTCATCHRVRGTDAMGTFGPDLTYLARRRTLGAGAIPNDRAHLAAFIVDPHTFKPGSLMPPTHMTPEALHSLLYYLELLR